MEENNLPCVQPQGNNGTFRMFLEGDGGMFDVTPPEGVNFASFLLRVRNPALLDYEKIKGKEGKSDVDIFPFCFECVFEDLLFLLHSLTYGRTLITIALLILSVLYNYCIFCVVLPVDNTPVSFQLI